MYNIDFDAKYRNSHESLQSYLVELHWIHQAAVAANQDFSDIVNSDTKNWFVKAAVSQTYADRWRAAVTPITGKRLIEAQRITAGYIQLWFDTYIHQ